MREYLLVLLVAAAITYVLTPLVRRGSFAIGALHAPRERDVHSSPTPLLGGIAMYAGIAAGLLVAQRLRYLQQAFPSSRTVSGLLLAGGLLVLVGIVDDRWGIPAVSKLAGQVAAGGIIYWSGVQLYWLPMPNGQTFSLEPDLSLTLTILIVVVTINAVNFIDGLDGLAAGVVAVAGLTYLIYSYSLTKSVGIPSQSLPALVSALLAGACLGFLPHNFSPARIFMGDTGSMLLGLLLAYGPISSLASLDQSLLVNYEHGHPLNRFPTVLPLLLPVAILIIPYTDLLLAVIRRTRRGQSPLAADRQHLHHRLINVGHSQRQSVLIMYLWAVLFSGLMLSLSLVRTNLVWLAVATVAGTLTLLPVTMPRLRPWLSAKSPGRGRSSGVRSSGVRAAGAQAAGVQARGVQAGGVQAAGVEAAGMQAADLSASTDVPANGRPPATRPPARPSAARPVGRERPAAADLPASTGYRANGFAVRGGSDHAAAEDPADPPRDPRDPRDSSRKPPRDGADRDQRDASTRHPHDGSTRDSSSRSHRDAGPRDDIGARRSGGRRRAAEGNRRLSRPSAADGDSSATGRFGNSPFPPAPPPAGPDPFSPGPRPGPLLSPLGEAWPSASVTSGSNPALGSADKTD